MLTGYASVDTAIRSMKLGAYDYLTKPCKLSELHSVILKANEKKQLKEKNILLEEHLQRVELHDRFIGESKAIREVKKFISLVGTSNVPVLVLGETGTGKGARGPGHPRRLRQGDESFCRHQCELSPGEYP